MNGTSAMTPACPPRQVPALFAPVDSASLAIFRIVFGVAMAFQVFAVDSMQRVFINYVYPQHLFKYYGFEWVSAWPEHGMYMHFAVLGFLSLLVAAGWWYRVASALLFVGWTYVFLLDASQYQNHYYLLVLLCGVMACLPAHRTWSIDAWRNPAVRSDTVPAWAVWLLRFQIGVVFFYGGVAKLNADWLSGASIALQLKNSNGLPWFAAGGFAAEQWFDQLWVIMAFTYGGLLLDLLIAPALLWRRTRVPAFVAGALFHLINTQLFDIGVFPWFMMAGSLIFFSSNWPQRAWHWVRTRCGGRLCAHSSVGTPVQSTPVMQVARLTVAQRCTLAALAAYVTLQVLVPLRHHLYPGNPSWTRYGERFCWRMRLDNRLLDRPMFEVHLPATADRFKEPLHEMLTPNQHQRMIPIPDLALQTAHWIRDQYHARGQLDVQVFAHISYSLNGRPRQYLIDPSVDLAALQRTPWPVNWVSTCPPAHQTVNTLASRGETAVD